jgi:hypothetical protein
MRKSRIAAVAGLPDEVEHREAIVVGNRLRRPRTSGRIAIEPLQQREEPRSSTGKSSTFLSR